MTTALHSNQNTLLTHRFELRSPSRFQRDPYIFSNTHIIELINITLFTFACNHWFPKCNALYCVVKIRLKNKFNNFKSFSEILKFFELRPCSSKFWYWNVCMVYTTILTQGIFFIVYVCLRKQISVHTAYSQHPNACFVGPPGFGWFHIKM